MSNTYTQAPLFEHSGGTISNGAEVKTSDGEESVDLVVSQGIGSVVVGQQFEVSAGHEKSLGQDPEAVESNTFGDIVLTDDIKMELFSAVFDKKRSPAGDMNLGRALSMIDSYNENRRYPTTQANMRKLRWNEKIATTIAGEIYDQATSCLKPIFDECEIPEDEIAATAERIAKQLVGRYSGDVERGASQRLERKRLENVTGVNARKQARDDAKLDKIRRVQEIYD